MKLRRLTIERFPGIADRFDLEKLDAGLNIVLGPNASGKSSLCRAVRALLYDEEADGAVALEAEFEDAKGKLTATRHGATTRWTRHGVPEDRPALPDRRWVSCFTVQLEDLIQEGPTEQAIRDRIRTILAGGYDLDEVRRWEPFNTGPQHGRKEARELRDAESAFRRAGEAQRDIRAEEQRLDDLRERKEKTARAAGQVGPLRTALDLLRHRQALEEIETELSEFPESMDRLTGDETERLERLQSSLRRQNGTLVDRETERADAVRALDQSGLRSDELDATALDEQRQALSNLRAAEGQRRTAETELAKTKTALDESIAELGGALPTEETRIGPQAVRRAEEALGRKRESDAAIRALDERIAGLDPGEPDDAAVERTRGARTALSRWLAAPDWTTLPHRTTWPWVSLIVLVSLGGIAFMAWRVHGSLALLALLVLGACYPLLRRVEDPPDRRADAQTAYLDCGLDEPTEWTEDAVRRRLLALDAQAVTCERSLDEARLRKQLERERETLRTDSAKIEEDLRTLASEVGFDPEKLDGSFERWLRLVERYDSARERASQLVAERDGLAGREDEIRAGLLEFLAGYDATPNARNAGASLLDARLKQLEDRRGQYDEARKTLKRTDRDIVTTQKAIGETREEIERLFQNAALSLDDTQELRRRLELRADWKRAIGRKRDTLTLAREAERRLGDRTELLSQVEKNDEVALLEALEETKQLAGGHEEVLNEIHAIESSVTRATEGDKLEAARAHVAECTDRLRQRLNEERFAETARLLLDGVEQEHVAEGRPAVLRRAEEWFAGFTRHTFRLRSPGMRGESFLVRESSTGEDRLPNQLSSGTRMQLFLALRLAFAREAEHGCEPVPLFLDEALTVTDPERFRAIAECVHEFSRSRDRQVFYLTAQPHDVRGWEAIGAIPEPILLHEVRGLAAAISTPAGLELPHREEVPSSAGRTPEEYGAVLRVPALALWDPPEKLHLFHLLRDELSLLEQLANCGIQTLGQLRTFLDSESAAVALAPESRQQLHWRSAIVGTFLEAARQGRGRPVDRYVLEHDDAGISSRFLDRIVDLCKELNGDARALLDAIDAKQDDRVKGYRIKQRNQLQLFFEERGHLDQRPVLTMSEIELRLLPAASTFIDDGTTTIAKVTDVTRSLAATAFPRSPVQT